MPQGSHSKVVLRERLVMATITPNIEEHRVHSAATGLPVVDNEWSQFLSGSLPTAGLISRFHDETKKISFYWEVRKAVQPRLAKFTCFNIHPLTKLDNTARELIELFGPGDEDYIERITPSEQEAGYELSSSVRRQLDQILAGVYPNLVDPLSQFGNDLLGQEPTSEFTVLAVYRFVAWLCRNSYTASAVVSNNGMLSIAAVFPRDVRLYIEVDRDGSIEAAVTRARRYARDIPTNTIADLTPEIIRAAVRSI